MVSIGEFIVDGGQFAGGFLPEKWQAKWIWYPGRRKTVNFYFFARRILFLKESVLSAVFHISAHAEYEFFINGRRVGKGPNPSDPYHYQYYDTYEIKKFLKKGVNVFGVIGHSYGVGTHFLPPYPGRLIAQGAIKTKNRTYHLITDKGWRVKEAKCWKRNAPRMMWSTGFTEIFDFRDYAHRWLRNDYDDSSWENAEEIEASLTKPYYNLIPREIPFLVERKTEPDSVIKGQFNITGVHVISFKSLIPEGENRLGYAQTYFYSDSNRELTLHFSSDDAFKVFLNEDLVLKGEYDESFARTRKWKAHETYEQVHHGLGGYWFRPGHTKAKVSLKEGWNKILAVVDHGQEGWGFVVYFKDKEVENLIFSSIKEKKINKWKLVGPFPSTGLKNSLDNVLKEIIDASFEKQGIKSIDYHPFNYTAVTDCSSLMESESRSGFAKQKYSLHISEGECVIANFNEIKVGFPVLEIETEEEAVLDVGYSYRLSEKKEVNFPVRYVDRIYLRKGKQIWKPYFWRTLKYLHISGRKGKNVNLKRVSFNILQYPVRKTACFACSDETLNEIWRRSVNNTRLIMLDGYSDCLRREQLVCNTRSFHHASLSAAHCFDDYALARKTLLQIIRTQDDSGWFDSHGFTATNSDEPTQCLWWMVWLKDYYRYSGNTALVKGLSEEVWSALRYFSRMENTYGLLDCKNENNRALLGRTVYIDDSTNLYPYFYCSKNNEGVFQGELFGYNIMYYAGLISAEQLAEEVGYKQEASFYRKKAELVKAGVNKRFWSSEKGLYIDWKKGKESSDKSSLVFLVAALYFNLCDKEKKEKVFRYIVKEIKQNLDEFDLTFGFYFYLLELLFSHNEDQLALDVMRRYYGRWIELTPGGSTFGEYFILKNYKDLKEICAEHEVHGYGTSAHLHFYSHFLGIKPLEPGFTGVIIEPHPGNLEYAKGKVFIPQGEVAIAWRIRNSSFVMEIKLPKACRYQVKPPTGYQNYQIKVNGKTQQLLDK